MFLLFRWLLSLINLQKDLFLNLTYSHKFNCLNLYNVCNLVYCLQIYFLFLFPYLLIILWCILQYILGLKIYIHTKQFQPLFLIPLEYPLKCIFVCNTEQIIIISFTLNNLLFKNLY